MQKFKFACISTVLAYILAITAAGQDPFFIKTALTTPPSVAASCSISIESQEVLEFSARDLERRLSLEEGSLGGITLITLPSRGQGGLYLDGVEVDVFDFLDRAALDRLCFVPGDTALGAVITFLPQTKDAVPTSLSIQMLSSSNAPPEIEDSACETLMNVPRTGTIYAQDPNGDTMSLKLISKPKKGSVTIQGSTYTYHPYKNMTGTDTFTICAVDSRNAYSREATVNVRIESTKTAVVYLDMQTHPSSYASIKLRKAGVLSGIQIGDDLLFQPDQPVTRWEYVMMLLKAAGLEGTVSPTVNTGLPNDTQIPTWMKPYVKAAAEAGIISKTQPFAYYEIPIRAEAVLMCDNAAKITDVKKYALSLPDANEIPNWAQHAYEDLAAYRMLDLHDGYAYPLVQLTNSYAADLLWQLYKHTHR